MSYVDRRVKCYQVLLAGFDGKLHLYNVQVEHRDTATCEIQY